MCRSSSTSGSKPSRTKPPSRASAGGSSAIALIDPLRARPAGRRARRAGCAPAAPGTRDSSSAQARHRRQRSRQRHRDRAARRSTARCATISRSRSWIDFSVSRSLAAIGRPDRELFDRVEPIANRFERGQRAQQPGAQQPAAHRRHRAIDLVEQRSGAAAVRRLDDLEVLERGRIDQQAVGELAQPDACARARARPSACRAGGAPARRPRTPPPGGVRGRSLRGCRRAADRAASGAPISSSKCQPSISVIGDADLRDLGNHASPRRGRPPRRSRAAAAPRSRRAAPPARRARRTRRRRTHRSRDRPARRRKSHGRAPGRSLWPTNRHQERRLARVEIRRVGQRAGRDHAHDLALDHALGLLRVLDLLADRDAIALLHQPRDVAVGGVKRHAAHRHGGAGRVLRSRRQRQVERARRHQRVLVEHLVEIAHPEEQQRVAILPLRVEVLAHRRRHVGRAAADVDGVAS